MCFILFASTQVHAYKYGLGSCLDQSLDQVIWPAIQEEKLDGFIFLGDNVYGDQPNGELFKMKNAYDIQKTKLPKWLMKEKDILAIWDDHDFGLNDGGKDYLFKEEAKEMFLNFWNVAEDDPRNYREGLYFKKIKNIDGTKIEIIALDTRFFRSKLNGSKSNYIENIEPDATILGNDQWIWFENELNDDFDFLFIFSSIQIIAKDHRFEKWSNFPYERYKFLNLIDKFSDKTILFSGDRHRAGIYRKNGILEITSSSMNKPGSSFDEIDKYLIGETYPQENYSVLEIFENIIQIKIKDINGTNLNSISYKY